LITQNFPYHARGKDRLQGFDRPFAGRIDERDVCPCPGQSLGHLASQHTTTSDDHRGFPPDRKQFIHIVHGQPRGLLSMNLPASNGSVQADPISLDLYHIQIV
jgi:hypothetical protein